MQRSHKVCKQQSFYHERIKSNGRRVKADVRKVRRQIDRERRSEQAIEREKEHRKSKDGTKTKQIHLVDWSEHVRLVKVDMVKSNRKHCPKKTAQHHCTFYAHVPISIYSLCICMCKCVCCKWINSNSQSLSKPKIGRELFTNQLRFK